MKNYYYLIIIFFLNNSYSQSTNDYDFLNQVLPDLVRSKHIENLKIYERPAKFENQSAFFTEEFFQNNSYRVIGVDEKKVKKLIKILDFKYLSNQNRDEEFWNFEKIKVTLTKYTENSKNVMDYVERFSIAKPIYTKDKKFAFIYYQQICGGPDCGSATVKIYKQTNGKWNYYTQIPLWIS